MLGDPGSGKTVLVSGGADKEYVASPEPLVAAWAGVRLGAVFTVSCRWCTGCGPSPWTSAPRSTAGPGRPTTGARSAPAS
ncbi:hypothetical protein AB0I77_20005 [Streptomyces sp. NPDC050619]|uniref:hypothetical protein n=1 Tax=Streptomyces sp. NPDC050619 TaxID=3157214 RepID=UPI00341854E7